MQALLLSEIAKACGGTLIGGNGDAAVSDIRIDSRVVEQGDLFIAIKGENHDGHVFLPDAYAAGAVCSVVDRDISHKPYILVDSTFTALKDIAEYYRGKLNVKVVGITGSVGKTTAKEMIAAVLAEKYHVIKTEGNFNNEYGVPQMVFRIEPHHDIAVLELGMSGFGEISSLSKIVRPDAAVIMNIGESHIGNLGSRDGIFKAKREIFDYSKDCAPAFVCGDDDKLVTLERENTVWFGKQDGNNVRLKEIIRADMKGTHFIADVFGDLIELAIPKPGEYLVYPALAAVAVGKHSGLTNEQIARGIQNYVPVGMRMDIIQTGRLTIINDVYNACKQSMLAGAQTLKYADGRKVAIIGDILELGDFGQRIHFETGKEMGRLDLDVIICVGSLAMYMAEGAKEASQGKVYYFKTQAALFDRLSDIVQRGDTVFVKASRGMKFENIVESLKTI